MFRKETNDKQKIMFGLCKSQVAVPTILSVNLDSEIETYLVSN